MISIDRKLNRIERITLENNRMLKDIIRWINAYSEHLHDDNMDDFGRNILANLLSNSIDGNVRRQ